MSELDEQHVRGALRAHRLLTEAHDRIHELSAYALGGLELLVDKGIFTREELQPMLDEVRRGLEESHWSWQQGFVFNTKTVNKYKAPTSMVDCEARMHLCKGVCCAMRHALQESDVREGIVKWDLGSPYWIREAPDNRCVHQEPTGGCGVFEARPLVCRQYTCEADDRIWLDFEKRIPNTAIIEKILTEPEVRNMMVREHG